MEHTIIASGIEPLDDVLQGLRLGDNVVWQVDRLEEYVRFAEPFAERAVADKRDLVYLRFAPHPPVLHPRPGLTTVELDPSVGFDAFSAKLHGIISDHGRLAFYVFDNLSSLVEDWATDEQLANFFQVTCPYLFELDTVTYFALLRGKHDYTAIARIRDTTQVLIDVYHANTDLYMHPLKVWNRYSPQMFLPHLISGRTWAPVSQSGKAAAVSATGRKRPLRSTATSIAPWESVYRKLMEYREAGGELSEEVPEIAALKQELSRMIIGSHPEFSRLANLYLTLEDLLDIRSRLIGSGRIGGKAAGMLAARAILLTDRGNVRFDEVLEDHDSFFIGSDVFFTFLVNNDLFRLRLELSRNAGLTQREFEEVEKRFLEGSFPTPILEQFRDMLDYFGQAPIIVRSSSFLEDSFENAFAGKYRSEFCPNQGGPEERLEAFLNAVKLVYASALNPDALSYRRRRGLSESDEQMAVLVQRVSGMPYRNYFFPSLAGVAFSRNLYAWNNRIDPKKGMIRLVFGLGTHAVNRVGGDYPRMIAVSHPELRPEVGSRVAKYSQRLMDVLDLAANQLVTQPVSDVLAGPAYPQLHYLASVREGDYVRETVGSLIQAPASDLVLTFNKLVQTTDLARILGAMLARLEEAYGHPVDTEFTASVDAGGRVRVNLLQCRPMWLPGTSRSVVLPDAIPAERMLFRSSRLISGGVLRNIRYILYIDPRRYAAIPDMETKRSLGRIVGRINRHPNVLEGKILMMGPGRWGSSNIDLGVNVGYADIDNAAALAEVAHEESGHVPEVSYGTHFFQDLVEAQIIYLAVYPDDPGTHFNASFFGAAANVLPHLVPGSQALAGFVQVIDVPQATHGLHVQVAADAQKQSAVCYLE